MNEVKFWELIENVWADAPKLNTMRAKAIATNDLDLIDELGEALSDKLVTKYIKRLKALKKDELAAYIHLLEEKLYLIDRADIQKYTGGTGDHFLYYRSFIVALGKDYYEMVSKNPAKAVEGDGEIFGFIAYDVYEEKFGEEFERNSVHSIETGSNKAAW